EADRRTTLPGLYAAGDVAGGAPYKFVSGCWAEGVIAARAAVEYVKSAPAVTAAHERELCDQIEAFRERVFAPLARHETEGVGFTPQEMEERLQRVMDQYAGGVSSFYEMNEERLEVAEKQLQSLRSQVKHLLARDLHELMQAHEVLDRLEVAEVLVRHLRYRKETRWPAYQSRLDYPHLDDRHWLKFVNSRRDPRTGAIEIVERPYQQLVPGDRYLPK
ncbi:MAG: adenylylsulfate reductase, partial [Syntrophothermus sp.]